MGLAQAELFHGLLVRTETRAHLKIFHLFSAGIIIQNGKYVESRALAVSCKACKAPGREENQSVPVSVA